MRRVKEEGVEPEDVDTGCTSVTGKVYIKSSLLDMMKKQMTKMQEFDHKAVLAVVFCQCASFFAADKGFFCQKNSKICEISVRNHDGLPVRQQSNTNLFRV